MPMASDTEKRDQDVRGAGGHGPRTRGSGGRRAQAWVWSQGLKGMSRQRDLHEHARGSQLGHGTSEKPSWLPSIAPSALLKSAFCSSPRLPIPLLDQGSLAPETVFCSFSDTSPPQCLVQCLTLRRHKINAQQMKRWMRRKRRYIQELVMY